MKREVNDFDYCISGDLCQGIRDAVEWFDITPKYVHSHFCHGYELSKEFHVKCCESMLQDEVFIESEDDQLFLVSIV